MPLLLASLRDVFTTREPKIKFVRIQMIAMKESMDDDTTTRRHGLFCDMHAYTCVRRALCLCSAVTAVGTEYYCGVYLIHVRVYNEV